MGVKNIAPSDIQMNVHANNWQEALTVAAQPLLDADKITTDYITNMIESVKKLGPYIVIAPGLALGHARPSAAVKQSSIAIATLDQPVKFGNKDNDPVDLVIILASINDHDHLGLMKKIVTFLNNKKNLQWLRSASQNEAEQIADAINKGK
ncbi:PTS sugar transporter subunit IIA [[Lactobacillus] timonensis]|uniref:PTS sugar transporter subunit IIA n=1 Tax=[Lactobacillus] timonensis TaxID=1970790 RepID=UPI000C842AC0|nr:PTS sugar transporter subunit IIA [[Lactobacillus] timonensis]